MAIEQVAAVRVKRHEAELEKAIATAIKHHSRVRRVFKQLPAVAGTGLAPYNVLAVADGAFAVQRRSLRTTSAITAHTTTTIAFDGILDEGKTFIKSTFASEDKFLLDRLMSAQSTLEPKGARPWDVVLAELTAPNDPQTLLSLVPDEPDDVTIAALKKRNVAVVMATADICAEMSSRCAGLLVPANSDSFTLRVEKDWRMMWDKAGEGRIEFLMEAFWQETVRHGGLLRFV